MAGLEDVKVGKKLLIEGIPYEVVKAEHLKVAMGKGMEKTTLKNLLTGNLIPKTFREVDKVEVATIDYARAEYLYKDTSTFYFMNTETYDQVEIGVKVVGDSALFLSEGDKVTIQIFQDNPINVQLEPSAILEVVDTPPGEKGDTATGGRKPATLSTGLVVQVPLFIKIGDKLRVDTRTREYLSRA